MNLCSMGRVCVGVLVLLGFAHRADADTAKLSWTHSPDTTVTGYVVSYGTASHSYSKSVNVGYVTSARISGLNLGTTYYFVVQSYNSSGVLGAASAELVVGQAPPTISCPSPVVNTPDGKPVAVTLLTSMSGGIAPVTVTCSPASGSLFQVGTTSFTCTAVDAKLQKASCSSKVVVQAPTVAPLAISCPVIEPVTATGGAEKTKVTYTDPKVAGGLLPVTVQCTPKSGTQFALGTTSVSCVASDSAKQTASCQTSVTVLPKAPSSPAPKK
jgi:hypothetical protein